MKLALSGILNNGKLRLVDLDNKCAGFIDADKGLVRQAIADGGNIIGITIKDKDEIGVTDGNIGMYPKINSASGEITNEIVAVTFKDNKFTVVNGKGKFEDMTEDMLIAYYNSIGVANVSVVDNRVVTLNGVRVLKLNVTETEKENTVYKIRMSGAYNVDITDDGKLFIPDNIENVKRIAFGAGVVAVRKNGFYGKNIECKVVLSSGVKELEEQSFANVKGMNTIELNYGLEKICRRAFWRSSIESIVIPSTVTLIEDGAFEDCVHLTAVKLSSALKAIERNTFAGCVNMQDIVIPYSVKVVKHGAFENCSKLKNVTLLGGRQVIESGAFPRGVKIRAMT